MSYTVDYATEVRPGDEVVEQEGVRVLVDPSAIMFLLGAEMDYKHRQAVGAVRVQQSQRDRVVRLR